MAQFTSQYFPVHLQGMGRQRRGRQGAGYIAEEQERALVAVVGPFTPQPTCRGCVLTHPWA